MHLLFDDLVKSRMTFYMLSICMNDNINYDAA